MDKKELSHIIKNQILETQETLAGLKSSSKPVELDQQSQGRVSRVDAIQQQQMNLASLKRLEQKLNMLNYALENLKSEEFGICIECEEEISYKRLKIRPESRKCVKRSS